jgi:hypothetical protein
MTDEATRDAIQAGAFRRLLAHLSDRSDVQNIELMTLAGFCRNCLADWLMESAAERGAPFTKEDARTRIYGMPYAEWKKRHGKEATPEQLEAFEKAKKG